MTRGNDIAGVAGVLRMLIRAEGRDGRRLLLQEDLDGDHAFCNVCQEVDGHSDGCVVGVAEGALRGLEGRFIELSSQAGAL